MGFLGLYVVVAAAGLVWTPNMGPRSEDEEEREEEEETLLAGTGRRTRVVWEDLAGRGYGAVGNGGG